MDYTEIKKKRETIRKAVEQGTSFLLSVMEEGNAPAKKHDVKKPGIWTSAEMLEFLLTNTILPAYSLAAKIDAIISYILSEYDPSVLGWGLTADDPSGAFSAITTGHCIYVLKLYLNAFTLDKRKSQITEIISNAESAILSMQNSKKGYWVPDADSSPVDTDMNYGKLFYSFHAYYGIKKVKNWSFNDSEKVLSARRKANLYFAEFANNLIDKANADKKFSSDSQATLLGHSSNLIQVLSDIDETGNSILIKKLLAIVKQNNEAVFRATTVQIYELPANSYNSFHINTPFSVFFALLETYEDSEELLRISDWYLDRQDPSLHCWFYNANSNSGIDTWSTCEALLVLSSAYIYCFEKYYHGELLQVQKRYEYCDTCKKELEETLGTSIQTANSALKKAKGFMCISMAISIFSCLCAITAVIILSITRSDPWINVVSTAVVIPLILQIGSFLRIPELPELSDSTKRLLSKIEQQKELFGYKNTEK